MLCFNDDGLLPVGIYDVDLAFLEGFFGFNYKRQEMILQGLIPFLRELRPFNVQRIYIDGSFVTQKENPGDIDGYAITETISPLFEFIANNCEGWKEKYRVDFYAAFSDIEGYGSEDYLKRLFFNTSGDEPQQKGFVALKIG